MLKPETIRWNDNDLENCLIKLDTEKKMLIEVRANTSAIRIANTIKLLKKPLTTHNMKNEDVDETQYW